VRLELKILVISPFFAPIIGGVESVLETTCGALAQYGHSVRVLTSPVDEPDQRAQSFPIIRSDVLKVPSERSISPEEFDFIAAESLMKQIVKDYEPDVVHLHNFQMRQYAMFLTAFLSGVDKSRQVTINTLHNDADDPFCHYVLAYSPLDLNVTVTRRAALALMEGGVPPGKVAAIPNMLDTEKFRTANGRGIRKMLGIDIETPLILFPSRLIGREGNLMLDSKRGKGFLTLLRALPEILDAAPNAKVLLLGNDNVFGDKVSRSKRQLKEIASKIGVNDGLLFFDDYVTNEMLPQIYSASDIVVSLSARETFGMVFVEGMAAGKPVIGVNSESGGVPEVIKDGVNGFLVPKEDSHSTAKAIVKVIVDEEVRNRMGLEGIRIARQKFDFKVVLPKLISTYASLRDRKLGRARLEQFQIESQKSLSDDQNLNVV